ncbi:hypothetical protein IW140_004253 [Coemansia sp. RSA 1813]|nr:hypothetical protein LPJ74_003151 [Coemansia sp. RSA 1843]KAJ2088164.1 hypothetical protein IW138_004426 [Coemansia sp. RSA 986]KAJ2568008.1 hypothetical protein IW140_004253 [Coemansia sp. RSA 1813]
MGTLSAQIAHVFYLSTEAASPRVSTWSPSYLSAEALPWTQHVDLIWPTLDQNDQRTVLDQAKQIFEEKLHRPVQDAHCLLEDNNGYLCQIRLLQNVICNIHTPHEVRIAGLRHYADTVKTQGCSEENAACLIQQALDPWRKASELKRMAQVVPSHNSNKDSSYAYALLDDATSEEEGIYVASVTAALLDKLQNPKHAALSWVVPLVHQVFSLTQPTKTSASILSNAMLYACIDDGNNSALSEFRQLVKNEFIKRVLEHSDIDPVISFLSPIHGTVLARIAAESDIRTFSHSYLNALVRINKRCQDAMLNDCLPKEYIHMPCALATSDTHLSRLATKWQNLLAQPEEHSRIVKTHLSEDQRRFNGIVGKISVDAIKRPVFEAIVDVWNVFYTQLLG